TKIDELFGDFSEIFIPEQTFRHEVKFIASPTNYLPETENPGKVRFMKNKWSIQAIITVLVLSNLAMAAYIAGKDRKWLTHIWPIRLFAPAPEAKTAVVEPPKFKGDSELQICYESLLRRQPKKDEGQVVVHWRVGKTGKVDFLKLVHSDWSDEVFTG